MQLLTDVNATDKLAVHVELRVGRPLRVLLETLSHLLVLEYVKVTELNAIVLGEKVNNLLAEAASSSLRAALHKEHDLRLIDELLQA